MQPVAPFPNRKDIAAEALRIPPHSLEAEQAVLGGLMLDNATWDQVADRLSESDFYRADHRLIFRAVRRLAEQGKPFDLLTLAEWLEGQHQLDEAGGFAYLGVLARDTPSAANVRAYADIIRERSVRRELIRTATEIADSAYDPRGRDSKALLDDAEKRVFAIAERGFRSQEGFTDIKDLLARTVERIDVLFQRDNPITGIPTGWPDFDEMTAGLQRGDLIVIAGRPSMGKTSLAMNIVEFAAIQVKCPVAVFSMEMPGESLIMRLMSSLGRIDQHRVRTGRLEEEDWPRLTSAVTMLSEARLFIDDSSNLSPNELRARARRLHRQEGQLGLIVVDYLQLMQVPGTNENRATEVSEISRSLKALAKELSVPVLALSQLNRTLEQRGDKRPIMSDLRESGAIEQDADLICFIYRDEVYNPDSPDKGIAEIIVAKQRNGPIGVTRLTFLGQYTRFESYAPEPYSSGFVYESSNPGAPRSGGAGPQSAAGKNGRAGPAGSIRR
ncbi:MAG TPA: replicative DNA helicase [Candidatus Competibacteraceae bacterium]|nr:MAG: replicative DNA helicase [Candidatus Competibacteraceae bacterium]HOB62866.1 replicative DNA helicase [Candidatus Competibacteraceae bacterium]HQA26865.1 replicative DNA helicase [Candidatus Competibacteraceae bacterium]HQD57364.1 replicative DNA helicase [Candidatus Competibacteraceae bacterium]